MNTRILKAIVLAMALVITAVPYAMAGTESQTDAETETESLSGYKFITGSVSGYSGNYIIVNEGWKVYISHETEFFDESGGKINSYSTGTLKWVYVEGPVNTDGSINAEKVYVLSGYVGKKDKKKYPFIQAP